MSCNHNLAHDIPAILISPQSGEVAARHGSMWKNSITPSSHSWKLPCHLSYIQKMKHEQRGLQIQLIHTVDRETQHLECSIPVVNSPSMTRGAAVIYGNHELTGMWRMGRFPLCVVPKFTLYVKFLPGPSVAITVMECDPGFLTEMVCEFLYDSRRLHDQLELEQRWNIL